MRIQGTEGDDVLVGTDGNELIEGLSGDDTIRAGQGDDTADGGLGDDVYLAYGTFDSSIRRSPFLTVRDEGGIDTVRFLPGVEVWQVRFDQRGDAVMLASDEASRTNVTIDLSGGGVERFELDDGTLVVPGTVIDGTFEADVLSGTVGNDDMYGSFGSDLLRGGAGSDKLAGGLGRDTLLGEGGDDLMVFDGAGADTLVGEEGPDVIDGGDGVDVLRLVTLIGRDFTFVTMDLDAGTTSLALSFSNVERLDAFGTEYDDTFVGGALDDTLNGGALGADTLLGRGGDDWITTAGSGSLAEGGAGQDTIDGVGNDVVVRGGTGDDLIVAEGMTGLIEAGAGDDQVEVAVYGFGEAPTTLRGGVGNDVLVIESRDAGFADEAGVLRADLSGVADRLVLPTGIVVEGFEDVVFSAELSPFDWQPRPGAMAVIAGGGDDTLTGAGEADTLVGGLGEDALFGGSGDDVLYGDGGP